MRLAAVLWSMHLLLWGQSGSPSSIDLAPLAQLGAVGVICWVLLRMHMAFVKREQDQTDLERKRGDRLESAALTFLQAAPKFPEAIDNQHDTMVQLANRVRDLERQLEGKH